MTNIRGIDKHLLERKIRRAAEPGSPFMRVRDLILVDPEREMPWRSST
jgi:hypothetical protein